MITQYFGTTGSGKSANLARIIVETYYRKGAKMLADSAAQIKADNREFGMQCTPPTKPPIFVGPHLDVRFETDFEEYFEPYHLDPYRFGMDDGGEFEVQSVPPHSLVVIPEAQRYYDSRQSGTFHPRTSGIFEKHRHQHLDIIIESQRPDLIDQNIRRLTHLFVEMLKVDNKKNSLGRIEQTTFYTREFKSWQAVNEYLNGNGKDYEDKPPIVYKGNIFACYNSYACAREFLPKRRGDYNYLPSSAETMKSGMPQGMEKYYELTEPKGYRGKK